MVAMVSDVCGRLLTGERGEYEIAAGDLQSARKRLDTMAGFANDGLMIPEQVWDLKRTPPNRFRLWCGALDRRRRWRGPWRSLFRLAMNIESGRNLETPKVVWSVT